MAESISAVAIHVGGAGVLLFVIAIKTEKRAKILKHRQIFIIRVAVFSFLISCLRLWACVPMCVQTMSSVPVPFAYVSVHLKHGSFHAVDTCVSVRCTPMCALRQT